MEPAASCLLDYNVVNYKVSQNYYEENVLIVMQQSCFPVLNIDQIRDHFDYYLLFRSKLRTLIDKENVKQKPEAEYYKGRIGKILIYRRKKQPMNHKILRCNIWAT